MFGLFLNAKAAQTKPTKAIPDFMPGTPCLPVTLVELPSEKAALNKQILAHRCYQCNSNPTEILDKVFNESIDLKEARRQIDASSRIDEGVQSFYKELLEQEFELRQDLQRLHHLLFDIVKSGDIIQLELFNMLFSLPVNLYDTTSQRMLQCVLPDTIMHAKIMEIFNQQQQIQNDYPMTMGWAGKNN